MAVYKVLVPTQAHFNAFQQAFALPPPFCEPDGTCAVAFIVYRQMGRHIKHNEAFQLILKHARKQSMKIQ